MRISDEERREVAENLRHLDDETIALIDERIYRLTNEELAGCAVLGIGLCKAVCEAGLDTKTMGDFWDLLADLIDQTTCKVDSVEPIEYGEFNETIGYVFKLACGHSVMRPYMEMPPAYCDECGARVVRGDEG